MIQPKPAATVVVARDSEDGLEVLLLRRTDAAVFMPGVYVFPGGAVDRGDRDPALASRGRGIVGEELDRLLGVDAGGMGYLMAAIRECFEEAGLLLADTASGRPVAEVPDIDLPRWRRSLAAGEITLGRLCEELSLQLHTDRMVYLDRRITPPGPPRRFDARFFVAPAPPGQAARHDGVETTAHLWIAPAAALERNRGGELPLGAPTIGILRALTGFHGTKELLHHWQRERARSRQKALPATGRDGERPVHPEEPAYAEVARLHSLGLPEPAYEIIPGVARALSPRVTRLTAPNPGHMTGPGTNTYLVGGKDGMVVIDPGPLLDVHIGAILAEVGRTPLEGIVVTHTHRDHSPAARVLKERTGAPLVGMPAPEDGGHDRTFTPDRVLRHGERLRVAGATLRAIHTPGHASNHVCYLLEEENLLFSGDHIMQGSTVVISPPDGSMTDYLRSLEALHDEDIDYIAPGHGFLMGEAPAVVDRIIRHRLEREAKVMAAVHRLGPAAGEDLLPAVYDDVPAALHPVAHRSLLAHLIKLRDEGRIHESSGGWRPRL